RRPGNPIVPVGGMREALAMLPVHALDPPEGLLASLRALGIRTLGELAALDAASVAGRFGADGVRLHRLACGGRPPRDEAEVAWVEDELPGVSTPLAGATTTLQLHFVLPGLLQQLARALSDLGLAAVQLRCTLELDDGTFAGFGVRVGRPTRDVATLEHLVRTRLATVKLEAPVEAWRIEVQEAVPSAGWQPGLTDRTEAREPLPDVLARLIDALGEEAVFSAEPVDAWCPERAWRPVPFALRPPLRRPPPAPDDVVDRQERWDHALTWARPASLLESPVLIEVQGSPPARLRLPTGWLAVETATGPEVLSGSWWQPEAAWDREYWVVRLTGGRTAWIYAAEHHWWLHGWF
ncbi:MAG: hypothetical protein KC656_18370, partial [Myxococcales bacterium]|nr:hypothetical protein [Myxococcales bacterium]